METDVSSDFTKMGKEQYRSVIRFLFLEEKSRREIKESLDAVYAIFFDGDGERRIGLMSFNVVAYRFLMSRATLRCPEIGYHEG